MLYEHTTDISSSRGATVRYLIAAATKNTLQTTLQTLEKMANHSVELHRFIIMAAVSAMWKSPQNEEKCTLAAKLVSAALERSNALTLVATAVEESQTLVTTEILTNFMVKELKLSPIQQLQFSMGLFLGGGKGKEAAAGFLNTFNVSPATLKDDNGSTWALGILARQAGSVESLDKQLSNAFSSLTLFPNNGVADTHVSLSKTIQELGTACVATQADCRELLSFFPHPFTESDVAEVLGFFASQGSAPSDVNTYNALMSLAGREPTKTQHSATISPIPLLELLQERSSTKMDWDTILRLLDKPGEEAFRQKHVAIVFDAYYKFKGAGTPGTYPPLTIFLGRWNNVGRQRSALDYILKHPEKVSLQCLPRDQMAPAELLEAASAAPTSASPATTTGTTRLAESELWRFFPVVEAAVHVASRDRKFDVETLRPAAERHPLLLFSVLLFGTFPGTVKNFSTAKLILKERWLSLDRVAAVVLPEAEKRGRLDAVIMVLSELTMVDAGCTIEVMETVLKSKTAVKAFLAGGGNPRLVTAIAMCVDDSAEPGDTWISKALEGKLHFRANAAENRFAVAMSIVEVAEQLITKQKYVSNATAALNIFLASSLKDVLRDVAEQARALLASSDSLFPSDVENDANEFYRRMYAMGDPTNAASLSFIEQLRKSSKARDKQLYACILSIMFEEHSAIGCYPHKELQMFAVLYGQMIARELLPPNQQQHAWGLLLPTIVKPKDHMVEECGIIALEQIKPRLAEWPQYGRALRYVKDLDIKIPGIMAAINRGIKAEEAARQQQSRQTPPEKPATKEAESLLSDPAVLAVSTERRDAMAAAADHQKERSAAATLHQHDIGTLLSSRNITAPPRVIQEQINFLIGNTDMHNIEHNASELAKQLRPEYYEYFAEYLVIKRAALEPNYHSIYLELLDKLQSKPLEKAIRSATGGVHQATANLRQDSRRPWRAQPVEESRLLAGASYAGEEHPHHGARALLQGFDLHGLAGGETHGGGVLRLTRTAPLHELALLLPAQPVDDAAAVPAVGDVQPEAPACDAAVRGGGAVQAHERVTEGH
ncbi:CCR4-NOT transcription complex subunit 1 [Trypanosoma conorhini]|uniref:CCR4-NOT transcription complex subunit 1 n=1 Tax=Trypanosoma conorhini TaxID=83891 RepID=A0A422PYE4_9TRYP|nr:CCR4-NOT transcription complex subunit 1 [Trypanosoma conorhini]RNF22779.1 CCR4-NOT transcription complex subunit 1 [Trypanosoma conorhini]